MLPYWALVELKADHAYAMTDDNRIVLYKMESDVMMYVVGGVDENEILLYNVILSLRDSLHLLFK